MPCAPITGQIKQDSITSITVRGGVASRTNDAQAIDIQAIAALTRDITDKTATWRAMGVVVRSLYVINARDKDRSDTFDNDRMGIKSRLIFYATTRIRASVYVMENRYRAIIRRRRCRRTGRSRDQHIWIRNRAST
jgi:hypothetical protein